MYRSIPDLYSYWVAIFWSRGHVLTPRSTGVPLKGLFTRVQWGVREGASTTSTCSPLSLSVWVEYLWTICKRGVMVNCLDHNCEWRVCDPFVCLSVCLFICLFGCLFVCLSVCPRYLAVKISWKILDQFYCSLAWWSRMIRGRLSLICIKIGPRSRSQGSNSC